MWILPKNYQLSSAFALDMVASSEDLTLQGLNIESSLMWRSKPMRLQTYSRKWNKGGWSQRLFTAILLPSQHTSFETRLASSLAVIPVSHLVQQGNDLEQTTPGTFGLISGDTLNQLDLFPVSLKMSRDTLVSDSEKSLANWNQMVIDQRGEYSQRVKLALLTRESESTSWATPNTMDHLPQRSEEALIRQATTTRKGRTAPANLREQVNPRAVEIYKKTSWATPRAADAQGGPRTLNEKGQRISVSDPTKTYGANLSDQVRYWPTPSARDYKGANGYQATLDKIERGERAQMGQLPNAVMVANKASGKLNPDWVEGLMGLPLGWTALGSWGLTE